MIRIDDATCIGPALAQVRNLLGYSRQDLAAEIAEATGRNPKSIANQLAEWDRLENSPTVRTLGPLLDALGYQLALVPREDT
jgi:transcriptional regulator with XRE-family HTH domain